MTKPKNQPIAMDATALDHYYDFMRTSAAQDHAEAAIQMQTPLSAKAQTAAYLRMVGVTHGSFEQRLPHIRFFMSMRGLPHARCVISYIDRRYRKVQHLTCSVSSSRRWLHSLRYVSVLDCETQKRKRIDIDSVIKVTMETWAF